MRCFVSHKKTRQKKPLAEQDASSSAKMTRTLSAPPSFTLPDGNGNGNSSSSGSSKHPTLSSVMSAASPLNPQTPPRTNASLSVIRKQQQQQLLLLQLQDGSSSPLIPHSSGSISSGYNSLSGLKRDAIFRGRPLPLPTPESCGLSPDTSRFMPSPALHRNGTVPSPPPLPPASSTSSPTAPTSNGAENERVFRKSASMPLPRPPVERFASAHITFAPDTCCVGESGNGPAFTCTVSIDGGVQESVQAVLVRLSDATMQDSKAWIQFVKEIACLSGAHLSRILGFSFSTDEKLVVYEMQANGSLDRLLYSRTRDRPPLVWLARVRIAADAALGLAFLHERSPNKASYNLPQLCFPYNFRSLQLMYKDFRTFNIHVDKNLRARLMGYGFTQRFLNTKCPMVAAYAAPELLSGAAAASVTSNAWSFGVVLLEILTGRQNRDEMFSVEEQDLVKWTAPFLNDDKKLFLIVDPELKGMFPAKSVSSVAKLASQCLQTDPTLRPRMEQVASALELALQQEFKPAPPPSVDSSGGSDSRRPLIEALKEHSSHSPSPAATSALAAVHTGLQKRLVTKLLCSSASTFE